VFGRAFRELGSRGQHARTRGTCFAPEIPGIGKCNGHASLREPPSDGTPDQSASNYKNARHSLHGKRRLKFQQNRFEPAVLSDSGVLEPTHKDGRQRKRTPIARFPCSQIHCLEVQRDSDVSEIGVYREARP